MIEITNENCPSYKIYCETKTDSESISKSGTGIVVTENRILTARHVVRDVIAGTHSAWVDIPEQGQINLRICVLDGNQAVTDSLALLEPADPQQQLPKPPPLYRPVAAPKQRTEMDAYGYLGTRTKRNQYHLIEYAVYGTEQPQEHREVRNAEFKIVESPDDVRGLSGSPIFCNSRLFGVLNTEDFVNKKVDFVYGFCGDAFFRELASFGILLPVALTPPELNEASFKLPEEYQRKMTERLNTALNKQRTGRECSRQKPIFLRGPDGIGKKEFLWAFAKQYEAGYVYHLDFEDDFLTTIEKGDKKIVAEGENIKDRLRLLRECGESDILIITGADFASGYTADALGCNGAYKELCSLPLHLVITTRQPVPEEHGGLLLEPKQISVEELLSWNLDWPTALSSDPEKAKELIAQAENNPMLVRIIMRILCQDSSLKPNGMLEALKNPCLSSAQAYWDTVQSESTTRCRLFDYLDPKMPHPKNKSSEYKDCKDILILILDELQMCDSLTTAEFDCWVSQYQKTKAFDKLRQIGMIEEDPKGYYTIPIIPRLLLKRKNCGPSNSNRQSFLSYRSRVKSLKVTPTAAPEEYRKKLIDELTEKCTDPYDSFSLFCTANKQALETYLPELFTFGRLINLALARCGGGENPMVELEKAETLLAQICPNEQDQRTVLAAKLYDTFRSALSMVDYAGKDHDTCCNALLGLFDVVLKLRPDFIPCFVMKSQVYWHFGKEDEAHQAANEALDHADRHEEHYCADAYMILGQYLEKQANEQLKKNAMASCEHYAYACENYNRALLIRIRARKQNLQRNRKALFRLIQCKGMLYHVEPQRWKSSGERRWVETYGQALLENDWKIYKDCKIYDDFINDSKNLLTICLTAERGIGADTDSSVAKEILTTKRKLLTYLTYRFEKLPGEIVNDCIVECNKDLEELAASQSNPDTPDASNS